MEKKKPLLTVRPVFDPALAMTESILAGIAGATVSVFFLATFTFIILNILGLGGFVSAGFLYNAFFVLGLALSPALYYEVKRHARRRTVYHFHEDHVDYQDFAFLLIRRRGRVRLRDVDGVWERASPLQGRRVLTTVYVSVPGLQMGTAPVRVAGAFAGLKISDVPENAGHGEKILALVEDAQRRHYQQARG